MRGSSRDMRLFASGVKAVLLTAALALAPLAAHAAETREPVVNLDVKDADVRSVFQELKEQCGVRNLLIDREVGGSGATFYFHDLPCTTAFAMVARTFQVAIVVEENSVVDVRPRR
jgi:hypothetical protein